MRIWITGDFHRNIRDLHLRCNIAGVKPGDLVIVAGDDCLNYYCDLSDDMVKKSINTWGIDFLFVNGNHQNKPENISTYKPVEWNGGTVLKQEGFDHLNFAVDGEIYTINEKTFAICGGAYSVDKYYRALRGAMQWPNLISADDFAYLEKIVNNASFEYDKKIADRIVKKIPSKFCFWWADEQPSAKTKKRFEDNLAEHGWQVDYVITHTCPYKYIPTEMFLPSVNQDTVDNRTERWLAGIERKLKYTMWYAGHYHTDKKVDKLQLLYRSMVCLKKAKSTKAPVQVEIEEESITEPEI